MRATFAALVFVVACGGQGVNIDPDAAGGDGAVGGWTKLVSRSWSLTPNTEGYRCRRVQVPSDMWISAFRTLAQDATRTVEIANAEGQLRLLNQAYPQGEIAAGTLVKTIQ